MILTSLGALYLAGSSYASVTIYTTLETSGGTATVTSSAADPSYTNGLEAYNSVELDPPALPQPMPPLNFPIQLYSGGMSGLSIPQKGNFLGFSIELSVADQIREPNLFRFEGRDWQLTHRLL